MSALKRADTPGAPPARGAGGLLCTIPSPGTWAATDGDGSVLGNAKTPK